MADLAIQKICCMCGLDVAQLPRTKDRQGRYFCDACVQIARGPSAVQTELHAYPCDTCAQWFRADDVYQVDDLYVCRTCYAETGRAEVVALDGSEPAQPTTGAGFAGVAWYVSDGGLEEGPMTRDELELARSQQRFTDAALAWRDGFARWLPIDQAMAMGPGELPPPDFDPPAHDESELAVVVSDIKFEWTTRDDGASPVDMQRTWVASYSFKITNTGKTRRVIGMPLKLVNSAGQEIMDASAGQVIAYAGHAAPVAGRISVERSLALHITGIEVYVQAMDLDGAPAQMGESLRIIQNANRLG